MNKRFGFAGRVAAMVGLIGALASGYALGEDTQDALFGSRFVLLQSGRLGLIVPSWSDKLLSVTVDGVKLKPIDGTTFDLPNWGQSGYAGELVVHTASGATAKASIVAWKGRITSELKPKPGAAVSDSRNESLSCDVRLRGIVREGDVAGETHDVPMALDPSSQGHYSAGGEAILKKGSIRWSTVGNGDITFGSGLYGGPDDNSRRLGVRAGQSTKGLATVYVVVSDASKPEDSKRVRQEHTSGPGNSPKTTLCPIKAMFDDGSVRVVTAVEPDGSLREGSKSSGGSNETYVVTWERFQIVAGKPRSVLSNAVSQAPRLLEDVPLKVETRFYENEMPEGGWSLGLNLPSGFLPGETKVTVNGKLLELKSTSGSSCRYKVPEWGAPGFAGKMLVSFRGQQCEPQWVVAWAGKVTGKYADSERDNPNKQCSRQSELDLDLKLRGVSGSVNVRNANLSSMCVDPASEGSYSASGSCIRTTSQETWQTYGDGRTHGLKGDCACHNAVVALKIGLATGTPHKNSTVPTPGVLVTVSTKQKSTETLMALPFPTFEIHGEIDENGNIAGGNSERGRGVRGSAGEVNYSWTELANVTPR